MVAGRVGEELQMALPPGFSYESFLETEKTPRM